MHEDSWELTLLDQCHAPIASRLSLGEDEFPLVSFYAAKEDWTLHTTHRLISEVSGKRSEISQPDYGKTNFGKFKQNLDSPQVMKATIQCQGGSRVFLYESGYASMAPIHYFKFWSLKWPVWKETYRIKNEAQGSAHQSTTAP